MSKILDILHAPWAIDAARLQEIQAIYATHLRGDKIDIGAVEARLGRPLNNESKAYEIVDGVAIISVEGVIAKRMNLFAEISGGCSSQLVGNEILAAADDSSVHSTILYIDSPGGTVDGTRALMNVVREAGAKKPVVALVDNLMASAAYWFGSAASAIYISDLLDQVGSIGVIAAHQDQSVHDKQEGFKTTLIYAGEFKASGNPYEPLSKEDQQTIQDSVDYTYSFFVSDVAENRGVSIETVLQDMAGGRVFTGQQAIDAGLVDGVSTLDALVAKLNEDHAGDASNPSNQTKGGLTMSGEDKKIIITAESLQASHPEVAAELIKQGHIAGAAAELARIQAVEQACMPGHEALIAGLKFDGKTTGGEAAQAVVNAEHQSRVKAGADHIAEAPDAVKHVVAPDDGEDAVDPDASIEEVAQAAWDKSKPLQAEFGGNFKSYLAYAKAHDSGAVKINHGATS